MFLSIASISHRTSGPVPQTKYQPFSNLSPRRKKTQPAHRGEGRHTPDDALEVKVQVNHPNLPSFAHLCVESLAPATNIPELFLFSLSFFFLDQSSSLHQETSAYFDINPYNFTNTFDDDGRTMMVTLDSVAWMDGEERRGVFPMCVWSSHLLVYSAAEETFFFETNLG